MKLIKMALALFAISAGAAQAVQTNSANAGELRVLDKLTGRVSEVIIPVGRTESIGLLTLQLHECRYPAGNTGRDAFGSMSLYYGEENTQVFAGWMIASAPALNALDHPRYDVWMVSCINQ